MSEKKDKLAVTLSREFPGDEAGDPSFVVTAVWKNNTQGNDAIQALLGVNVGVAFGQMQDAKDGK